MPEGSDLKVSSTKQCPFVYTYLTKRYVINNRNVKLKSCFVLNLINSQKLRQSRMLAVALVTLSLVFVSNGLKDTSNVPGK